MNYVCGDNRFEIIERYKKELTSATNIEGSPDEMAVLDNILFRFWQMGWLKEQETKYGYWINPTSQDCHCSECGEQPVHEPGESVPLYDFCPYCGAKMEVKWNE